MTEDKLFSIAFAVVLAIASVVSFLDLFVWRP